MSSAANNAIYGGLKFAGLALTVASDLAKSVRKDLIDAQEKEARVSVQVVVVLCSASDAFDNPLVNNCAARAACDEYGIANYMPSQKSRDCPRG